MKLSSLNTFIKHVIDSYKYLLTQMLKNITSDLDLLLNEMCDLYQSETSQDTPRFQTLV